MTQDLTVSQHHHYKQHSFLRNVQVNAEEGDGVSVWEPRITEDKLKYILFIYLSCK